MNNNNYIILSYKFHLDHVANSVPHSIQINPLAPSECQASVSGFNPNSAVCGRATNNPCDADAGSALACTRGNGKYLLKGIYSGESGCGSNQVVTFTKMDVQFIKGGKNGSPIQPARNGYTPQPNTPQVYSVPSTQAPRYLPPQGK